MASSLSFETCLASRPSRNQLASFDETRRHSSWTCASMRPFFGRFFLFFARRPSLRARSLAYTTHGASLRRICIIRSPLPRRYKRVTWPEGVGGKGGVRARPLVEPSTGRFSLGVKGVRQRAAPPLPVRCRPIGSIAVAVATAAGRTEPIGK